MTRIKLILFALVVASLSLGLVACGDDEDEGGDTGGGGATSLELTIGNIVPQTGDLAAFGPPGEKAAELALSEINAAIEEYGADHTIELATEDEQTEPQAAQSAARKLVGDGSTCIAGAWASSDTVPVAESVTIPEEVVQITPASTRADITTLEDDGFLFRTAPPDSLQAQTLADIMDQELGGLDGKTVNIGARNDAYGTGFIEFLTPALEELGATVGAEVVYEIDQPSYDSEADQIVEGNPDAFVIIDFPEPFNKVGPALVRTGSWDPAKTFITDGLIDSTLPDAAGEEAVDGLRGTAPSSPDKGAAIDAFDAAYGEFDPTNVKRQTFDAQNFDAVMLCYLGAVAAGSIEGVDIAEQLAPLTSAPGTQYTFEDLPAVIEALENGEDIDFEGASGPIDLDENGDPSAALYSLNEFDGATLKPVGKPIPVGTLAE